MFQAMKQVGVELIEDRIEDKIGWTIATAWQSFPTIQMQSGKSCEMGIIYCQFAPNFEIEYILSSRSNTAVSSIMIAQSPPVLRSAIVRQDNFSTDAAS